MSEYFIRMATVEDASALLEIYAPYVKDTAITFEYSVPSEEEFRRRIECVLSKYPYLVAEKEGEIVGYAYASPFHIRAAYEWAVETSIYIKKDKKNQGIGKKLYEELERLLKLQNILNLYACIAYPETEDEYLTKNSVHFHQHLGYRMVGEIDEKKIYLCRCMYDAGSSIMWLQK